LHSWESGNSQNNVITLVMTSAFLDLPLKSVQSPIGFQYVDHHKFVHHGHDGLLTTGQVATSQKLIKTPMKAPNGSSNCLRMNKEESVCLQQQCMGKQKKRATSLKLIKTPMKAPNGSSDCLRTNEEESVCL
jgi:hypothetical protein